MKITKVLAKEYLNLWKDKTKFFNGSITQGQFESVLLYKIGFSQAEVITLTMALILAGAKFAEN